MQASVTLWPKVMPAETSWRLSVLASGDARIRAMRIGQGIERLVWDDWNREHIGKHAVAVHKVEEVVAGRWIREETYKGRSQLIGSTGRGRILSVIVGPVPNHAGAYYVFSARPASSSERRRYDQAKGGDKR
jgi:uncharacterized DUF497 family protein